MKNIKPIIGAFITTFIVTLLGVFLFFKKIEESDTSSVEVSPLIGLIIYSGICTAIFQWAMLEMKNVYKAAMVVALPQLALIIDLMIRGERGVYTALAGGALLFITWASVAFIYSKLNGYQKE